MTITATGLTKVVGAATDTSVAVLALPVAACEFSLRHMAHLHGTRTCLCQVLGIT